MSAVRRHATDARLAPSSSRAQDLGHIFVRQRTPVVVRALVQALVERL